MTIQQNNNQVQALKGIAVCMKSTNLPVMIVLGNESIAKEYILNETSTPIEQYNFYQVNIVLYQGIKTQ